MKQRNVLMRGLLADNQLVILLSALIVLFLILLFFGSVLAPLLVALGFAYVLDDVVNLIERCKVPRLVAIVLVASLGLLLLMFGFLAVLPLLVEQLGQLVSQVPDYVQRIRILLQDLQTDYAGWINPEYVQRLLLQLASTLQSWGGTLLSKSLETIPSIISLLIYIVLVPVSVFFLLKDKDKIIAWVWQWMPRDSLLISRVWQEVDVQIGNFIRGKFWETLIVGIVTWVTFALLGSQYALLLGVLTGLSVWVPFVGAAVVTLPVIMLSFFQWNASESTLYALIAYIVIQVLDGNVLVPWLFSEVVNLHPIAIILSILVFGSIWGLVGVFFAIPLASLVNSVLRIVKERVQAYSNASSH